MRTMKPRRAGGPHDVLARMFGEIAAAEGAGPEAGVQIAAEFEGVSVFTLYKQLDPDQAGSELSFVRLWRLVAKFGSRAPAAALAELVGCRLVALPKRMAAEAPTAALISIARETTEVVAKGWDAVADGELTPREARALRPEVREAINALLEFDARLELIEAGGGR